jgi:DNA-binding response OmpR family regulator
MFMNNFAPATQPTSMRVLLVHPSPVATQALASVLERAGMTVAVAQGGARAIEHLSGFSPHVALVALDLGDMNGTDLIHWFGDRDFGLIGLDESDEGTSRVVALEAGADDCLSMSLPSLELVARIRAVHRRMQWAATRAAPACTTIDVGPISINLSSRVVTTGDKRPIGLTGAEFSVLAAMVERRGETVSRDVLSQAGLRKPWRAEDRSVDQLVFGLRQKLPLAADGFPIIQTVRGAGYVLRTPETGPKTGSNRGLLPMPVRAAVIGEIVEPAYVPFN